MIYTLWEGRSVTDRDEFELSFYVEPSQSILTAGTQVMTDQARLATLLIRVTSFPL